METTSWTGQSMSAEAAHTLGEYGTTAFVLHNGVMCTVAKESCAMHGKANKDSNKIVFGMLWTITAAVMARWSPMP